MNISEIEKFIIDCGSDDLPTFGGSYEGGCHIQQIPDELANFIVDMRDEENLNNYLEIGVAAGGLTFVLNQYMDFSKIVLVDDNKHRKAIFRKSILKGLDVVEIIGSSHEKNVISSVKKHSPFDLIFIDGIHTYEGVCADAKNYIPMLRDGGIVAFHDSALPKWGAYKLCHQLLSDPLFELISDYQTDYNNIRACGITSFRKKETDEN